MAYVVVFWVVLLLVLTRLCNDVCDRHWVHMNTENRSHRGKRPSKLCHDIKLGLTRLLFHWTISKKKVVYSV